MDPRYPATHAGFTLAELRRALAGNLESRSRFSARSIETEMPRRRVEAADRNSAAWPPKALPFSRSMKLISVSVPRVISPPTHISGVIINLDWRLLRIGESRERVRDQLNPPSLNVRPNVSNPLQIGRKKAQLRGTRGGYESLLSGFLLRRP